MRICFELLDLLKAHKKAIRRAAVNSFGYIAKSLGPQDVLQVLLTNLRVQERQSRVCSTVAIGIVAETCGRKCSPLVPALVTHHPSPSQRSHVFPLFSTNTERQSLTSEPVALKPCRSCSSMSDHNPRTMLILL